MGTVEIRKGLWQNKKESGNYQVIGNALIVPSPTDLIGKPVDLVGTALFVEGYEETGKVSGEKIQVYEDREGPNRLRFLKMGKFEAPNTIVVYRQLEKGKEYEAGQLWWRSPENFAINFTPLDLKRNL